MTSNYEFGHILKWQGQLIKVIDIDCTSRYQGLLEFVMDDNIVVGGYIFSNEEFLRHYDPCYMNSNKVSVYGTFCVCSWIGNREKLVTINATLNNNVIPPVYAVLNDWTRNAYIRLWYDEQTKMELLLYRPLTALNKTTVDANNTNDYSQITENQNRMQEIQQGLFDQRQPGEQYTIEDVNNFVMNGYHVNNY